VPRFPQWREKGVSDVTEHPPSWYTDSGKRNRAGKFVLHNVGTQLSTAGERAQRLDTPSLLSLHRSAPYLHHGQAKTLQQVLTTFNPADEHGRTSHLSRRDIHALVEFLRHLELTE
jgi:cytochrome c peroxidase